MDGWTIFTRGFYIAGVLTLVLAIRLAYLIFRQTAEVRAFFHTLINVLVGTVWVLLLVESSPWRNTISDYGAPIGFVSMLGIVPLSYAISALLMHDGEASGALRSYVRVSRVLWVVQLVPAVLILFFWYAWASGR